MSMQAPLPKHNPREVNKRFFKPLRRLIKMNYFRFKVRGANHIPSQGPTIFVANHSGWVAIDALFMMMAIHDTAGPEFLPYIIVHDMLLKVPLVSDLLKDLGTIPADLLHYGREPLPPELNPIAIFPEGADGNSKPFWKAYHMQPWKTGFVRLAIQRRAQVVPVTIIGGEESVPVAQTLDAFKPLLGSVAPLPVSLMPLPSRWKIEFLEPLDFSTYDPALIHSKEACREIADQVFNLVQTRLEMAAKRNPLLWLSNMLDREQEGEDEKPETQTPSPSQSDSQNHSQNSGESQAPEEPEAESPPKTEAKTGHRASAKEVSKPGFDLSYDDNID
ncbi:MAG: lysophospholipid acyltransferase family protein [Candidatus Sericytochromatia bacterium]